MRNQVAVLAMVGAVVSAAIGVAACGSDDESSQATGGSIEIAQTSQPEALDPAISYSVEDWQPMWLVYTPLLTYRHAEGEQGAELIPGLAEDLPKVGNDGKTYELTLRKGLKFSDGTPLKASDFEHSVKRVLNLKSGGSSYFTAIDGAEAYLEGGEADADIPGIETDNASGEIKIELTAPDASFSNVLAMNFAGLVPGTTPFENMTKDPAPGVGPYMFTKSVPNREYVMEKNPRFGEGEIPGVPEAKIETITTKIMPNVTQQTQDVIDNRLDFMQDPPAADMKAEVLDRFGPEGSEEQRYKEFETLSTYFFFLNVEVPPFDDRKAREAVAVGIDKPGLARLFAGELTPGCSFLPPGMPGFTEDFNVSDCPWGDPNQPPDLERARRLLEEAGAEGAKITVWGNSDEPTERVTLAYADQLNQIGFDAKPEIVNGSIYFATVGKQSTEAQTGFANWFADFPHPLTFFPLVDGSTLEPANNINLGRTDDAKINSEIEALRGEPDLPAVTDRWESLNEYVVDNAYLVPYGHTKLSTFVSDRIDFDACTLVHPLYATDYSSFCLKGGG